MSDSFHVKTAALRTAEDALADLATDTGVADSYKSDYLDITGSDNGVLFAHIDNVNNSVRSALDALFTDLRSVLHDSGVELGVVAKMYDDSDAAARERNDAVITALDALPHDQTMENVPDVPDTVPEDPGDYEPEDAPEEADDGEQLMAPGPLEGTYPGSTSGSGGVQA
jgi:hypothetical protein